VATGIASIRRRCLHLRSCYVTKAAILTFPVRALSVEIEVPLEFQGLDRLGAASWRMVFPCEFDAKERALWLLKDPSRFGSVRPLSTALFELARD